MFSVKFRKYLLFSCGHIFYIVYKRTVLSPAWHHKCEICFLYLAPAASVAGL